MVTFEPGIGGLGTYGLVTYGLVTYGLVTYGLGTYGLGTWGVGTSELGTYGLVIYGQGSPSEAILLVATHEKSGVSPWHPHLVLPPRGTHPGLFPCLVIRPGDQPSCQPVRHYGQKLVHCCARCHARYHAHCHVSAAHPASLHQAAWLSLPLVLVILHQILSPRKNWTSVP